MEICKFCKKFSKLGVGYGENMGVCTLNMGPEQPIYGDNTPEQSWSSESNSVAKEYQELYSSKGKTCFVPQGDSRT